MSRKKANGRLKPQDLIKVLDQPLTVSEVAAALGRPKLTAERIRKVVLPEEFRLFEQKNELGCPLFVAAQQKPRLGVSERNWAIWESADRQPYIWIQFPTNIPHKRLRIIPLSDVHYGSRACNVERFQRYINWIGRTPEVFTFLNGDIIENAIDGSIGGSVYESLMSPEEQIWGSKSDPAIKGIIEMLRPIAHKILWTQPGNHEWRTWKKTNIDPLRIICSELGIPYYSQPVFVDVLAFGHRFTFYCHHGKSGSGTKGGKMNAANRPTEFQEAVDFVIMGHVHDSMANPVTRIIRKRDFDADGNLVGFRLEERAQYTVICPAFLDYFDSYASRCGYAPGSWGGVSCTLYPDGGYRASE